jgi:hypothetical protein
VLLIPRRLIKSWFFPDEARTKRREGGLKTGAGKTLPKGVFAGISPVKERQTCGLCRAYINVAFNNKLHLCGFSACSGVKKF